MLAVSFPQETPLKHISQTEFNNTSVKKNLLARISSSFIYLFSQAATLYSSSIKPQSVSLNHRIATSFYSSSVAITLIWKNMNYVENHGCSVLYNEHVML